MVAAFSWTPFLTLCLLLNSHPLFPALPSSHTLPRLLRTLSLSPAFRCSHLILYKYLLEVFSLHFYNYLLRLSDSLVGTEFFFYTSLYPRCSALCLAWQALRKCLWDCENQGGLVSCLWVRARAVKADTWRAESFKSWQVIKTL